MSQYEIYNIQVKLLDLRLQIATADEVPSLHEEIKSLQAEFDAAVATVVHARLELFQ